MAKKIFGVVLLACFVAEATDVRAQGCPSGCCEPGGDCMGGWGGGYAPSGLPMPPSGPYQDCPMPPPVPIVHMPQTPDSEFCAWKRGWFEAENLLWWISNPRLTLPLVTTGLRGGDGTATNLDTAVLLGGSTGFNALGYNPLNGGRGTAGVWFDKENTAGVEVSGFGLENMSGRASLTSDGLGRPRLSVPFFNLVTNAEAILPIAIPGAQFGFVTATNTSRLFGGEGSFILATAPGGLATFRLLMGFRYARFEDTFTFQTDTAPIPPPVVGPTFTETNDYFSATNSFYGGQIGLRSEIGGQSFSVVLQAKLALGNNHEVLTIRGNTTTFAPGALPATVPGGFFAVNGNTGRFAKDVFALMPEGSFKLAYHPTDFWTFNVGYNFLWWSDAMRGIDQLNRQIDPRTVPVINGVGVLPLNAPGVPSIPFRDRSIWVQGITAGLELKY